MVVYTAVIFIVAIFEITKMKKEGLKKEIVFFIPLALAALALAWVFAFHSGTSISAFFLKSFGIPF